MESSFKFVSDYATAAYVKAVGAVPSGFDPATILAIIMSILQAISGSGLCPKPPTPKSLKEACSSGSMLGSWLVESHTRQIMRAKYGFGGYNRFHGDAIRDAVIATCAGASEDTIADLLSASS